MSILIKGMEMPTGSHEIIIRIQSDGCVLDQYGHRLNREYTAVPVPPHGRLIDADAYIAYCGDKWIPLNIDAVNAQPTIIPAEEETNDRT